MIEGNRLDQRLGELLARLAPNGNVRGAFVISDSLSGFYGHPDYRALRPDLYVPQEISDAVWRDFAQLMRDVRRGRVQADDERQQGRG